jgi:ATP-dependent helicase/nuclease subunit A
MCDESQDMSPEQWSIVSLITDDIIMEKSDNRTFFVIGDIKQSIYSFQGADPEHFLRFYNSSMSLGTRYGRTIYTVNLLKNYRSSAIILSSVDDVFSGTLGDFAFCGSRYEHHIPSCDYPDSEFGLVRIGKNDLSSFAKLVSRHICSGVEVSLLVRERSSVVERVIGDLASYGIDFKPERRIPMSDILVMKDLISFANIFLGEFGDTDVACLLRSEFLFDTPVSDAELFELCHNNFCLSDSVFELDNQRSRELREFLSCSAQHTKSIFDFFYYVFDRCLGRMDHSSERAFIELLLYVLDIQENVSCSMADFIDYFKNCPIGLTDSGSDCNPLMTIHSSKGLEFESVFLLDFSLSADRRKISLLWNECGNFRVPIISPTDLELFDEISVVLERYLEKERAELLRLLYVAMTRAKKSLYIVGPVCNDGVFSLIGEKVPCYL